MKLTDFLLANHVPLAPDYRVHLATPSSSDPLTAFFKGQFKEWQEWQGKDNFKGRHIVSLIQMRRRHKWLFAGVYEVLGREWLTDHFEYSTQLVAGHEEWIGRVVAHHEREGKRKAYRIGDNITESIRLDSILEERMVADEFQGFNRTCIPYASLRSIVQQDVPSWRDPLSNVKGIYLITDRHTGKQYVGKADGESGIWQRWCNYVAFGHGGNIELRELLGANPPEYLEHFQFSILEIADFQTSVMEIGEREGHWKEVLQSRRPFGYNAN